MWIKRHLICEMRVFVWLLLTRSWRQVKRCKKHFFLFSQTQNNNYFFFDAEDNRRNQWGEMFTGELKRKKKKKKRRKNERNDRIFRGEVNIPSVFISLYRCTESNVSFNDSFTSIWLTIVDWRWFHFIISYFFFFLF